MTDDPKRRRGGPTSRDVARALNIAQSTVSRAFTAGASISPALRSNIYATAEQIGYRPNLLARGLIAGRSRLVAVVLARQTNLLYPELLYELSGRLAEHGYQALLFPVDDDSQAASTDAAIAATIDKILAYRVDAVFSTGVINDRQASAIIGHHLPLVMFNRVFDLPVSSVSCDFEADARDLTRRLLASGHSVLGLVAGRVGSPVSEDVIRGVDAVAAQEGATVHRVHAAYAYESGADAVDALLDLAGRLPTALICVNDTVAAGCLDHLRDRYRAPVPDEVAVVAFEGSGPSGWRGYRLSGMRQPVAEMTAAAVELLLDTIERPTRNPERRLLRASLVQGSTAILG